MGVNLSEWDYTLPRLNRGIFSVLLSALLLQECASMKTYHAVKIALGFSFTPAKLWLKKEKAWGILFSPNLDEPG